MGFRRLTPEEDAILRAEYPNGSSADLACKLSMTTDQLSGFAASRGIKKTPEYMAAKRAATMIAVEEKEKSAARRREEETRRDITAIRIQTNPAGNARRTAHGTAYTNGNVTLHVML